MASVGETKGTGLECGAKSYDVPMLFKYIPSPLCFNNNERYNGFFLGGGS